MSADRSQFADRARALVELSALERNMRTLLSMIEARATDPDGLERASLAFASQRLDAVALVERFRGAAPAEIEILRRRLVRLADLDAVLRSVCSSELSATAAAIGRVRSLRAQLDTLASIESPGDAFDCVR